MTANLATDAVFLLLPGLILSALWARRRAWIRPALALYLVSYIALSLGGSYQMTDGDGHIDKQGVFYVREEWVPTGFWQRESGHSPWVTFYALPYAGEVFLLRKERTQVMDYKTNRWKPYVPDSGVR